MFAILKRLKHVGNPHECGFHSLSMPFNEQLLFIKLIYNLIEKSNRKWSVCVWHVQWKIANRKSVESAEMCWQRAHDWRMKNENIKVSISFPWFLMVFDIMFDYGVQSTLLKLCNQRQWASAGWDTNCITIVIQINNGTTYHFQHIYLIKLARNGKLKFNAYGTMRNWFGKVLEIGNQRANRRNRERTSERAKK